MYFQYCHYSICKVESVFHNGMIKHFYLDFLVQLGVGTDVINALYRNFFERETQQETKRLVWIIFPFGMQVHLFTDKI